MKNQRLSFADFKAKVGKIEENDVLEKIQGGDAEACHGFLGQLGKKVTSIIEAALE